MDDFEIELKRGFIEEAEQMLIDTEQCFLQLESVTDNLSLIEKIFRVAQ